ncbi:MAG: alcohol dehydrogenase, partial [Rhodospirillales bacterium]|nr:alcohol dehydrogenase [Rhodospirillales bacterium]
LIGECLTGMMRDTGLPNGLAGIGYTDADIPALIKGVMAQQRLLVMAPRDVGESDVADMLRAAMRYW